MANLKKIGEVFSYYKTNSNLKYAQITSLNVVKKNKYIRSRFIFWRIFRYKRNMVFRKISKGKISIWKYRYKNKISRISKKEINKRRMAKYHSIYVT